MTSEQKENFRCNNSKRCTPNTKKKNSINLGFITSLMFLMITFMVFGYILVKNDLSIKGFVINDLQKKIHSLENEKEKLEYKLMNLESYGSLSKRVEELKMVKADQVQYIEIGDSSVAKR